MKPQTTSPQSNQIKIHQINVKPPLSNSSEPNQSEEIVKLDTTDLDVKISVNPNDVICVSPDPSPIHASSSIRICCAISCILLILFIVIGWLWLNEELNFEFSSVQQFGWNLQWKKIHSPPEQLKGGCVTSPNNDAPYLFPRPPTLPSNPHYQRQFFVTGVSNSNAGIGHQFGEWLMGPYLAIELGIRYVHHEFGIGGMHHTAWNGFLQFGVGEDTLDDLQENFPDLQILTHNHTDDQQSLEWTRDWVHRQMSEIRAHDEKLLLVTTAVASNSSSFLPLRLPPILFRIELIHLYPHTLVCQSELYATLRRKYCRARRQFPVVVDLYQRDRLSVAAASHPPIIIAFHLRCGDACYNPFRTTSFASTFHTAERLRVLLSQLEPTRPLAIHLFSEPPRNTTAEEHFQPLIQQFQENNFTITTHFEDTITAPITLHHLITADIFIGGQSSLSWLGGLLHHGLTISPIVDCTSQINYDKESGAFNETTFKIEYRRRMRMNQQRGQHQSNQSHDSTHPPSTHLSPLPYDSAMCAAIRPEVSPNYPTMIPAKQLNADDQTRPHLILAPHT